jgi:hypothetical protein
MATTRTYAHVLRFGEALGSNQFYEPVYQAMLKFEEKYARPLTKSSVKLKPTDNVHDLDKMLAQWKVHLPKGLIAKMFNTAALEACEIGSSLVKATQDCAEDTEAGLHALGNM